MHIPSPALQACQRIGAAVIGGYALTASVSVSLAAMLPFAKADATLTGPLLSFIAYAATILYPPQPEAAE